jgi:hypothetical protein
LNIKQCSIENFFKFIFEITEKFRNNTNNLEG